MSVMTVERFNAEVGADIKEFQRKMQQVDQQIRDLATGVDVEIRADISDFLQGVAQVNEKVSELDAKKAKVEIEAALRDFIADVNRVQAEVNKLDATHADVEIRAVMNDFKRDILQAKALAQELDGETIDINVRLNDKVTDDIIRLLYELESLSKEKVKIKVLLDLDLFYTQLTMVNAEIAALERSAINVKVDIDSNSISAEIARIQALLATLTNNPNINIQTNSMNAVRQLNNVNRAANRIQQNIFIKIWVDYTRAMQAYANTVRAFAEAGQQMLSGAFMILIPILAQLISVLVGLIGSLGVMIGVLAGQFMVLASAIGVALIGFAGLAAVAIPTIKNLFDETAKLNAEQQKARGAWDGFVAVYDEMVKKTEGAVLQAFTSAMNGATKILKALEPLVLSVADSAAKLMASFNKTIDSGPIQKIFNTFNKFGPEIFTNMTSGIGNLVAGLLSLIAAFTPAAATWSETFNGMMESFAAWSDGLTESEGFKAFVEYIQTYMPVISEIFANLIVGIVEFFTAFSGMGADFMTSLAGMTERFREWASALGENQQFQAFLAFIKDSTPAVLTLLGNLWNLIINLGVAMAPVGAVVLDLTNKFLAWFNSALETNDAFSMFIGILPVVLGLISALVPIIITILSVAKNLISAIGGIGAAFTKIMGVISKIIGFLGNLYRAFAPLISTIMNLASRALPLLMRGFMLLSGPIGVAIAIITTLITIGIALYKNWDTILGYAKSIWGAIADFFSTTVVGIFNTVMNWFGETLSGVVGYMKDIGTSISDGWDSAVSYLEGIDLIQIGKDIVNGLVNGISNGFGKVKKKVKELADLIPDWAKEFLGIHSPSRVMIEVAKWIPAGVAEGILRNVNKVKEASKKMSDSVTIDFSKQVNKSSSVFKNLMKDINKTVKATAKMQQAERYDALEQSLTDYKKWTDLTLEEEYGYWQEAAKYLKAGTGAKNKALKNASDIHQQILQEQFENEIDFIDAAREYGMMSLADQIKAYEEYITQYKVGTEQQVAYEEKLYNAKKDLYNNLQDIASSYLTKIQSVYDKLADEEQKLRDQYQQTFEARKETLANTWGLFDEVKLTEMTTYKEDGSVDKQIDLIGNMRQQVSTLSNWMNDIFRLQSFGLDEALLDELQKMGPKAAAEINALANMSSQELNEYQMLWKTKMDLAGQQATSELAGAREDMEKEIVKLRENAVVEIEKLKFEMLKEVDEMVNGSVDEFDYLEATLPEIGRKAMEGLINSFKSMSGSLKQTVQGIANDIGIEMSEILSGERFNASSFAPSLVTSRNFKVDTSVYNDTELAQPPVNVTVHQNWTGSDVKAWIDEEDATNAKLNIKKR